MYIKGDYILDKEYLKRYSEIDAIEAVEDLRRHILGSPIRKSNDTDTKRLKLDIENPANEERYFDNVYR